MKATRAPWWCGLVLGVLPLLAVGANGAPTTLKVSQDGHFLVRADGTPFFYLGDTAWELFHRLNREEAEKYLRDRAAKHFTVIQAVVLAEENGLHTPNPYGHTPLVNDDPAQPNEKYFEQVDWIVAKAEELGLVVGMLPTWADKVGPLKWGVGPVVLNEKNARVYGEFLGKRYRDRPIIWILGGDRAVETEQQRATWEALAAGLKVGDGGTHLLTYHPAGRATSADYWPDASWLDFHMWQNGHQRDLPAWANISRVYTMKPAKPVIDGEPLYEDHPLDFKAKEYGYSNAADIRAYAYWDLFAGACGHTYGHHSVWQMAGPRYRPVNRCRNPAMSVPASRSSKAPGKCPLTACPAPREYRGDNSPPV